eukprot:763878-Hanusia_phi.AAC.5
MRLRGRPGPQVGCEPRRVTERVTERTLTEFLPSEAYAAVLNARVPRQQTQCRVQVLRPGAQAPGVTRLAACQLGPVSSECSEESARLTKLLLLLQCRNV